MSFYDDASLVLIPSGIKTSKVYSQKPTDGTGDLTFSRASTATRTNASGVIEAVASNVPRLDYSGGATCPRLLLEGQRTNLFLQSEAFNSANWTKTNVTLTSGILSPDGTSDAFRAESTGVASMIQALTMTNGLTYNISLWIKSAGTGKDTLRLLQQTNRFFDVTATSEWVRYNFSFTNTYPTAGQNNGITRDALGNAFDVYIYGFQIEVGSFVSSYIPTTTATVTRVVDIAEKFGIGSLIGSPAGTIFLQVQILSLGYGRTFISLQDASYATNSIRIECTAANRWRIQIRNASTTILDQTISTGSPFTTGNYKIAYAYNTGTNEIAFYANGVSLFTGTAASIPTACVNLFLGSRLSGVYDQHVSDSFDQALLFKTRLTNSQLLELTTL